MRLHVLIDLDSTVVDLCPTWYAEYNRRHDDDLHIDKVTDWNTALFAKAGAKVFDVLNEPGFFFHLPPLPGAVEGVRAIYEAGHRVTIVTATPDTAPTAGYDKKRWVLKHLPFICPRNRPPVVDTAVKDAVRGDVLIDDGPHNVLEFRRTHPDTFIIMPSYPYNRKPDVEAACDAVIKAEPGGYWKRIVREVEKYAGKRMDRIIESLRD